MKLRDIYLEILSRGLLNIRSFVDDEEQVFAQSDHLHNMPDLLANFDRQELHDFYWNSMRPSYVSGCQPQHANLFDDLWTRLDELRMKSDREPTSNQSD